MKPLSAATYIKSNLKKVFPSFICSIISVFLIYIFGLILYGSISSFNCLTVNLVKNATYVHANNKPISDSIMKEINNDSNVYNIIPLLNTSNHMTYKAAFGNMGVDFYNLYSEDVENVIKNFNNELTEGRIPKDNAGELLLPIELAKQYKLKVGDVIDNSTNSDNIHVSKTYKIVGITKGSAWMPIVCDVEETKREVALKSGVILFLKDSGNMSINEKITGMKDKNIVVQEYKSIKEAMDSLIIGINILYCALSIIILIVLCLSLGNLNYITFLNRKNEFAVLATIGLWKSKLRIKLLKENAFVCFMGFGIGALLTTLVIMLLNITVLNPKGQYIPVFRFDSILVALIIPFIVSIISMLSSIKEFNRLSCDNLNI